MTAIGKAIPPPQAGGEFYRHAEAPFPLRAMRLPGISGTLDFNAKLALLRRLEELKAGNTTGLILSDAQAEPVLGLAGRVGLYAMVEIAIEADELTTRGSYGGLLSRVAQIANVLRGHPALLGYLIACPIGDATLARHRARWMRRRLGGLIEMIRRSGDRKLVAVRHRARTLALFSAREDLLYAQLENIALAELGACVAALHRIAAARPLVIEFGEGLPGQDELVAHAFGLGAAGVVAPTMRRAVLPGWLSMRRLSAGELLPFAALTEPWPSIPDQAPPDAPSPEYQEIVAALHARPSDALYGAIGEMTGAIGRALSETSVRLAVACRHLADQVERRAMASLRPQIASLARRGAKSARAVSAPGTPSDAAHASGR